MLKRRERRDFCPICGVRVRRRHRCDPKFLQRRDALMKMERVEDYHKPLFGSRLELGFMLLSDDDDDDGR